MGSQGNVLFVALSPSGPLPSPCLMSPLWLISL